MKYALGSTMDLLGDEKRAVAFKETMESLANATPVLKQYGGMIQIAKKLPLSLVKLTMPRMAGLLEVQLVRIHGPAPNPRAARQMSVTAS